MTDVLESLAELTPSIIRNYFIKSRQQKIRIELFSKEDFVTAKKYEEYFLSTNESQGEN